MKRIGFFFLLTWLFSIMPCPALATLEECTRDTINDGVLAGSWSETFAAHPTASGYGDPGAVGSIITSNSYEAPPYAEGFFWSSDAIERTSPSIPIGNPWTDLTGHTCQAYRAEYAGGTNKFNFNGTNYFGSAITGTLRYYTRFDTSSNYVDIPVVILEAQATVSGHTDWTIMWRMDGRETFIDKVKWTYHSGDVDYVAFSLEDSATTFSPPPISAPHKLEEGAFTSVAGDFPTGTFREDFVIVSPGCADPFAAGSSFNAESDPSGSWSATGFHSHDIVNPENPDAEYPCHGFTCRDYSLRYAGGSLSIFIDDELYTITPIGFSNTVYTLRYVTADNTYKDMPASTTTGLGQVDGHPNWLISWRMDIEESEMGSCYQYQEGYVTYFAYSLDDKTTEFTPPPIPEPISLVEGTWNSMDGDIPAGIFREDFAPAPYPDCGDPFAPGSSFNANSTPTGSWSAIDFSSHDPVDPATPLAEYPCGDFVCKDHRLTYDGGVLSITLDSQTFTVTPTGRCNTEYTLRYESDGSTYKDMPASTTTGEGVVDGHPDWLVTWRMDIEETEMGSCYQYQSGNVTYFAFSFDDTATTSTPPPIPPPPPGPDETECKYTQAELVEVVTEAVAAKNAVISDQNQIIEGKNHEIAQLIQTVAQNDQVINALAEVNGDGIIDLKDVIWGLKILTETE